MQDVYQILWISDTYICRTPANTHLSDSRKHVLRQLSEVCQSFDRCQNYLPFLTDRELLLLLPKH